MRTADKIEDGNYKWDKLGYYMNSAMIEKHCGKKVTLSSVACKDENGYVSILPQLKAIVIEAYNKGAEK